MRFILPCFASQKNLNAEFDHPEAESYIACLELPAATSGPEEVQKENATPNVQNNSNTTLKEAFSLASNDSSTYSAFESNDDDDSSTCSEIHEEKRKS